MRKKIFLLIFTFFILTAFLLISTFTALADVPIDAAHFPDPVLREYVSRYYDTGWYEESASSIYNLRGSRDNILSDKEISGVIDLGISNITSLKGVEYFTSLKNITLSKITSLQNIGLGYVPTSARLALPLYDNQLTNIDVKGCAILTLLDCGKNQLTELDVSGCTALKTLQCGSNQITQLDVSGLSSLNYIHCANNQLEKLNVRNCTSLTQLYCDNNQLSELDVSSCGALTAIDCVSNHIAELDLSRNKELTSIAVSSQTIDGLQIELTSNGYKVDLSKYVSKLENIVPDSIRAGTTSPISFDVESGIVLFKKCPSELFYRYNTHSPQNTYMGVTIKRSLNVDVLERKGDSDNIICNMNNDVYLNENDTAITESYIADIPTDAYGKLGFTADGNSRLILRANTEKSGNVTFSLSDNIGATLENLTDRTKKSKSTLQVKTSDLGAWGYQASAVLVAPEKFPSDKKFPSDTFKVHVKFEDDEGATAEKDLELKIEAAPVVLIHGLWGSPKIFGFGEKNGVYKQLTDNKLNVSFCNYDGSKSPSEIIANTYNRVFNHLATVFDEYYERRIVCTKADIVAFGMGGLVAEKFLQGTGKEIRDGNNWSVRSYKQGMVRRLIEISTPHHGTPWADFLLATQNRGSLIDFLRNVAAAPFQPLLVTLLTGAVLNRVGAFEELKTTAALNYILPEGVPMYAVQGDVFEDLRQELMAELFDRIIKMKTSDAHSFNYKDLPGTALFYVNRYVIIERLLPKLLPRLALKFIPVIGAVSAASDIKSLAELSFKLLSGFLFGEQRHDMYVSVSSAAGDFGSSSTIKEGMDYEHFKIAKQNSVGSEIVRLLKGSSSNFVTFRNEQRALPAVMTNAKSAPDVDDRAYAADEVKDFEFIEVLKLNIEPSVFKVSDNKSQTVKIRVTSDKPVTYDIFCGIAGANADEDEDSSKLFIIPPSDSTGKNFEEQVTFSGQDTGLKEIFCFSHNPDDTDGTSILISNAANISVLNNLENINIVSLEFLSGSTIYANVNSEVPAGLYATDSDGNMYDVSSPLNGTEWICSPSIATVNENGCVYGLKGGTASLTAKFKGFSASINVDVGAAFESENEDEKTPLVITKTDLPFATVGTEYNVALTAESNSSLTWSAKKLPDGLNINPETGVISGVPTKAKTSNFTVTVINANGMKSSETFTLALYELPSIVTASAKEGTVDKNYSAKFKANGSKPITWSATGLPNGLSINSENGTISGTTSAFGTFPLIITAENPAGSDDMKVNLVIHAISPKISGKFLAGNLSEPYSSTITLSKGTEPIEWTLEGILPEGLSFDKKTATLSGTPAQTWNGNLVVTASNDAGVVQKLMTLKIKGISPKISGKFEKGLLNEPYSSTLSLLKGTQPVSFSYEGNLPDGLSFNPETLTLSGTPSELWNDYITVTATNGAGSHSKAFKIQIKGIAPKILTSSLPFGNVNENYDFELEASGSQPLTWTAENLPEGLSLNGNKIEGTPTETCSNLKITIRAENPLKTVSKTLRLTINEAVIEETSPSENSETISENQSEEISSKSEGIENEVSNDISKTEKIIFGAQRDVSSINLTVLNLSEDYEIAAVLPEIHVTESGMYEIEVELDENIEIGKELIWLACPKNSEPSDDDKIAEFYDEEGMEIKEVPENHKITVSAWFNEGVIYEPVIAVKIK